MSLLPPNSEGNAAKDGTSSKGGGKKDKDGGKGGTKKDQDGGKGAKRRRSGAGGESSSGFLGARTALPPCLTLPCLVEVIDAGTTSQVQCYSGKSGSVAYSEVPDFGAPRSIPFHWLYLQVWHSCLLQSEK